MRSSHLSKGLILIAIMTLIALPSLVLSQTADPAKLEQAKAGILSLMTYNADKTLLAKGTGFAIAENAVVTAYHLVSFAEVVEAVNIKGKKYKVDGIIAVDRKLDVAIVRVKGKFGNLSITNSDVVAAGSKVSAVGPNEAGDIVAVEASIRAIHNLPEEGKIFEASFGAPESFTGAPILDQFGQILGITLILEKRGRFIIPSNSWRSLNPQANVTEFKNWNKEDYFGLMDGAMFSGRMFAAADDQGGAQKYLEKAVKISPSNVEAQLLLASVYIKQRDYQSAVNTYKRALELDPSRADVFFVLGDVQIKMTQFKDAAASLEKGLSMNPQKKEALFSLGGAYQELKEFAKAAEALEKFLNLKPDNPGEGYFRLGQCRAELGQYDAAIAALEEAVRLQPKNIRLFESLAETYKKAKQYEKAEEVYLRLIQTSPESSSMYYGMIIRMYDEAGNPAKAVESAKKLVELNPRNESNLLNLGYFYDKMEKLDEAIDAFKKTLEIKPDNDYAWARLGASYYKQKKYKEAIEAFKKYAELSPNTPDGWLNMGVSYMLLKNYKAALEPMQKAVQLKPDNGSALYNLALVYLNLQENAKAREVYKQLTTIDAGLAEKLRKVLR